MLVLSDTYAGPSMLTAAQIDQAFLLHGKSIPGIGNLIVQWAPRFGFRAEAVAGQVSLESGWGTNFWTTQCNNMLSIGVTGETSPAIEKAGLPDWQAQDTPQGKLYLRGYRFPTVEAGLLAGLIHMATYIYGRSKTSWPVAVQSFCGDTITDPRLPALLATSYPGTVSSFGDLGNGKFAAAAGYGVGIVARANTMTGSPPPVELVLGIPADTNGFYAWLRRNGITVVEHYVSDGWIGRGGLQPEAIVHHVTDGESVLGSINWWERNDIDGSTQQIVAGINDPNYPDGALIITRRDEDTAWGNGAWGNPNLSLPTIKRWQTQNINPNRVTLSREHSGKPFSTTFPSEAQMRTSLFANLQWIAKYPNILPDRSHLLKHSDIDSINRANCPGSRFPLAELTAKIVTILNTSGQPQNLRTVLDAWEAIRTGSLAVLDAWGRLRKL